MDLTDAERNTHAQRQRFHLGEVDAAKTIASPCAIDSALSHTPVSGSPDATDGWRAGRRRAEVGFRFGCSAAARFAPPGHQSHGDRVALAPTGRAHLVELGDLGNAEASGRISGVDDRCRSRPAFGCCDVDGDVSYHRRAIGALGVIRDPVAESRARRTPLT